MGKRTWLALPALALAGLSAPVRARAEVLDYDYLYLSRNGTELDGRSAGEGNTVGGFVSFGEHTHVFASVDDGGLYAGRNPAWDYDVVTWRAGIGGHYRIGERTMVAPAFALLRVDGEAMAPAWTAPRDVGDTGWVVQLDVRHAITRWLEVTAAARHTRLLDARSNEFVGGVLVHPTDAFAFGALHHVRDGERSTELTVRWYY